MLFFPVLKTAEGEMGIIYSLDLAERFDELGEVFETQPLVINLGDRRIDDDRSLSCVHKRCCCSLNMLSPRARILGFGKRSAPSIRVVKQCHADGEPRVVNRGGPPKDPPEAFSQIVLRPFGFHKLKVLIKISARAPVDLHPGHLNACL